MSWRNLLASIFGDFCGGSNCPGVTPTIPAKKADPREFQECYCARIGLCWAPSSRIRNHTVEVLKRKSFDRTSKKNPGIVDQDIQMTKGFYSLANCITRV